MSLLSEKAKKKFLENAEKYITKVAKTSVSRSTTPFTNFEPSMPEHLKNLNKK